MNTQIEAGERAVMGSEGSVATAVVEREEQLDGQGELRVAPVVDRELATRLVGQARG